MKCAPRKNIYVDCFVSVVLLPGWVQNIVISMTVCLFVCLFVYLLAYGRTSPIFLYIHLYSPNWYDNIEDKQQHKQYSKF